MLCPPNLVMAVHACLPAILWSLFKLLVLFLHLHKYTLYVYVCLYIYIKVWLDEH